MSGADDHKPLFARRGNVYTLPPPRYRGLSANGVLSAIVDDLMIIQAQIAGRDLTDEEEELLARLAQAVAEFLDSVGA